MPHQGSKYRYDPNIGPYWFLQISVISVQIQISIFDFFQKPNEIVINRPIFLIYQTKSTEIDDHTPHQLKLRPSPPSRSSPPPTASLCLVSACFAFEPNRPGTAHDCAHVLFTFFFSFSDSRLLGASAGRIGTDRRPRLLDFCRWGMPRGRRWSLV
jgi:hypothetical protein